MNIALCSSLYVNVVVFCDAYKLYVSRNAIDSIKQY